MDVHPSLDTEIQVSEWSSVASWFLGTTVLRMQNQDGGRFPAKVEILIDIPLQVRQLGIQFTLHIGYYSRYEGADNLETLFPGNSAAASSAAI